MAIIKFNLENNYKTVPEGERILTITKAEATPSGKPTNITVGFKDTEGGLLTNKYNLKVEGAVNAFGVLCRIALALPDMAEFDTTTDLKKLLGKKVKCEVTHTQGTEPREDGTYITFANIKKVISLVTDEAPVVNAGTPSPRQQIATDDLD